VADQTGSGTLTDAVGGLPEVSPHGSADEKYHHGRPISWVGVVIVIIGFVVGGIAMVPGPKWWLFWTGTGIAVVGLLILAFARTFDTDWY
jgi:hypothetical protein